MYSSFSFFSPFICFHYVDALSFVFSFCQKCIRVATTPGILFSFFCLFFARSTHLRANSIMRIASGVCCNARSPRCAPCGATGASSWGASRPSWRGLATPKRCVWPLICMGYVTPFYGISYFGVGSTPHVHTFHTSEIDVGKHFFEAKHDELFFRPFRAQAVLPRTSMKRRVAFTHAIVVTNTTRMPHYLLHSQ